MKLQVVTVSVNYSDFLIHSISANKKLFDKWIIVTDTSDSKTKQLCYDNGVMCIQTDVFYTKGIFNKYAGINEGLKYVDEDAWVLFLDSDIILHEETRRVLENLPLQPENLYGVDRLNCSGPLKWQEFKKGPGLLVHNWLLTCGNLELGSRLVHYYGHEGENGKFEGWRPLGFFQLTHRSSFKDYPEKSLGADNCDLEFARQWPRSKRVNIPELLAIHLESENIYKGINWYGRKSEKFIIEPEPDNIPESEEDFTKPKIKKLSKFCKITLKILWWIVWIFTTKPKPY